MKDPYSFRNVRQERPWYKPALKLLDGLAPGKALDLGCGLCEFSERLKQRGYDVSCADGSSMYVEAAKKLGFSATQADFNDSLPFQNEEFDLVSSLEVIEHVEKAEEMLKEIRRILKPGGYALLSTPNYAYINVRLKVLFGQPIPDEGYHFRFFTRKQFLKQIVKSGLKPVRETGISFIPLSKSKNPLTLRVPFLKNAFASKMIILASKPLTS